MSLLQHLFKIKTCRQDQDIELLDSFEKLTSSLDIHNVFNPSFYCDNDVKIFSFRALPVGSDSEDDLTCFLSIEDEAGRRINKISDDLYPELSAPRLIDPKITQIRNEFYITFNSGWVPGGNDIFIMKIYPQMGAPKRVVYKGRQEQERNWAFFSEQGEVYALYGINPLKILKLKNASAETWEMEDFYCGDEKGHLPDDLTIGTQLFEQNNRYYFVAHRKWSFRKKKIYLGKLCSLDFSKKKISPGKYWLAHSLKSLLGSRLKTNCNLFSCTYFSGLQISDATIQLGYGVNDIESGFSRHEIGEFEIMKDSI